MWEELERYRRVVTLESGERILLRPLKRDDGKALVGLVANMRDHRDRWEVSLPPAAHELGTGSVGAIPLYSA